MTMSRWHVVYPVLLLCLMAAVVAVSSAQEEGGGNGRSGSSVSSRRNRAEGQEGRRTRATRNKDLNEVNKPRQRKKDRKVNIGTLELVVREALQQQLEPLNTALRLVKLDTFTENVHRQLSTLEHIQSKLLTEYGELRASVAEIGRNTNDIGRAVNGLEQKMAMMERSVMSHSVPKVSPPRQPEPSTQSDTSTVTQQLQEAVASVTSKLQATERRFKENLATLENRTTDAIRKSHQDLERRLSMNNLDNVLIMHSLDKLVNRSCGKSPPVGTHGGRSIPGDAPQSRRGRHDTHMEKTQQEDDLAYFPVDPKDQRVQRIRMESGNERLKSWLIRETGRPASEVNTFSLGMVTRLASEIARQIQEDSRPETLYPRDCSDISAAGETESGVYTIYPASCTARFSVQVWCEMSGGSGQAGWTVIQRRGSQTNKTPHPVVDFFRDWAEYKWGFGSLDGEYWLGNEYLHQLTQSGDYELRVDLQDWSNETRFATYRHVSLDPEARNYTLFLGDYEGTAGNSLKYHQGAAFSTRDRDNDLNPQGHCARTFHGAWWFTACHESHLNGRYHHGRHKSYGDGINWLAFRGHNYSLKFCRMMIRPAEQR